MFAIVIFTFVVYMIPGLWGAPLKAIEFDLRWHSRLLSDCPNKRLLRIIDDLKKIKKAIT